MSVRPTSCGGVGEGCSWQDLTSPAIGREAGCSSARESTIDVLEISLANSTVGVMDIAASWRREYHHPREPRRQRKEPASGSGLRSPHCFPCDLACAAASSPSALPRRSATAPPAPQFAHCRGTCSVLLPTPLMTYWMLGLLEPHHRSARPRRRSPFGSPHACVRLRNICCIA